MLTALTVDIEDWFHILDTDVVPQIEHWPLLETRIEQNMDQILTMLRCYRAKATFFWLGWVAERHKHLVQQCAAEGHEIGSHGYAHVLPWEVGERQFRDDIVKAKACLEDITGAEVSGFRAPGFGITKSTPWAFDVIKEVGYLYDASVFPGRHGHGGLPTAPLIPHLIETRSGVLVEVPVSVVRAFGRRVCLFGGGYLRLAPQAVIKWGVARLAAKGHPLIIYFHPRDIDPDQPRLPMPLMRRFKCYVNLHTTYEKIRWLCATRHCDTMRDLMNIYLGLPAVDAPPPATTDTGPAKTVFDQASG